MEPRANHGGRIRPMTPVAPTKARILIVLRDSSGTEQQRETIDVFQPENPARRHEQLVSAVTARFPDARVYRSTPEMVGFSCRSSLITASYLDATAGLPTRAGFSDLRRRASIAPPGSDEAIRAS